MKVIDNKHKHISVCKDCIIKRCCSVYGSRDKPVITMCNMMIPRGNKVIDLAEIFKNHRGVK